MPPDLIVGQKEIAEQLRVPANTVHQWVKRGLLPNAEGSVGGSPAWHLSTIQNWARETGRMPGLRQAVLDRLLDVAYATTTPLAHDLMSRGFGKSVGQVWRAINDLHHEGLVGIRLGNEWYLTDIGKTVVQAWRSTQSRSVDGLDSLAV